MIFVAEGSAVYGKILFVFVSYPVHLLLMVNNILCMYRHREIGQVEGI